MKAKIALLLSTTALVAVAAYGAGLGDEGLFLHDMRARTDSMHGAPLAAGNTFSPLSLTSLKGWYKSDTGVTVATGVSSWADQSGNNNHLVQGTGGKQPALTAGAVNGLPALTFDGTDDDLGVAFTHIQPSTVFIVFRQVTWAANDAIFDGNTSPSNLFDQSGVSPQVRMFAGTAVTGQTVALGTWSLATVIFNGASSAYQINNVAETTGNAGASNAGGLYLGSRGGGTANFANVEIAEVAIMAAVASASERSGMRSYLSSRYAISM